MRLILSPRAEKQLRKLSKLDQIAVAKKIRSIRDHKSVERKEKLRGYKNIFRIRVGNYRIVYKQTTKKIYVVLIHHRRDVYKLLKRLFG